MIFLKSSITIECSRGDFTPVMFLSISGVYIKEEPKDAASLIKIEPEMKSLIVTKNGFDGIDIKEEPLQDDFVSELLNRKKNAYDFSLTTCFFNCSYCKFTYVNWL